MCAALFKYLYRKKQSGTFLQQQKSPSAGTRWTFHNDRNLRVSAGNTSADLRTSVQVRSAYAQSTISNVILVCHWRIVKVARFLQFSCLSLNFQGYLCMSAGSLFCLQKSYFVKSKHRKRRGKSRQDFPGPPPHPSALRAATFPPRGRLL